MWENIPQTGVGPWEGYFLITMWENNSGFQKGCIIPPGPAHKQRVSRFNYLFSALAHDYSAGAWPQEGGWVSKLYYSGFLPAEF